MDEDLSELLDSALDDFKAPNKPTHSDKEEVKFDPLGVAPVRKKKKKKPSESGRADGIAGGVGGAAMTGSSNSGGGAKLPTEGVHVEEQDDEFDAVADELASSLADMLSDAQGPQKTKLQETLAALSQQAKGPPGYDDERAEKSPDDINEAMYEQIVGQFESLSQGEDMQRMMDAMLQQLLSKEVLYEPMKEIAAKYPTWLEENKERIKPEEHARYSKQLAFVNAIVAAFEDPTSDFVKVVSLLQEMQACGMPPQEIMRELTPGMEFGQDGLPVFPEMKAGAENGRLPPELAQQCTVM